MRTMAFAARNAREIVRDPLSALFGIGFPVVLILLISMMKRSVPEMPAEMFGIAAFTPGMAVFGLSFLSLFLGMLIANDRSSAFLMRLFACPMTGADYILGYSLPMLPLALLQGVVCYVTALFFGLPVSVNLLPGLAVLLVPAMLFIALGLLLGSFYNVCIHRYVSGESILHRDAGGRGCLYPGQPRGVAERYLVQPGYDRRCFPDPLQSPALCPCGGSGKGGHERGV